MTAEIAVEARLENLEAIREFVTEACRRAGAGDRICFDLKLAVDEACTNIIEHGYVGRLPGAIAIRIEATRARVAVTIVDHGAAFAPSELPEPDLTSDWDSRAAGGLGWHLIRSVVDDVDYRPDAAIGNRLILIKRLGPKATA
jgi:serine/threonine-protein kinase RsbW